MLVKHKADLVSSGQYLSLFRIVAIIINKYLHNANIFAYSYVDKNIKHLEIT